METVFRGAEYLKTIESTIYKEYFINNMKPKQISEKYSVKIPALSFFIKTRWGLKTPSESRQKYKIDLTIFENIDSEWKSYFLGWMVSDGNIYTGAGKSTVSLCITESDKYILDYFNSKIYNGEKPLNYRESRVKKGTTYICKPLWRFQIDSSKVCKDLIDIGVIPNKSLIKEYPNCLSDENMVHFIRGYFEGNGSIGINNKKNSLIIRIYSGSELFIKELQIQILNLFDIPTKLRKSNLTVFSLSFGKRIYVEKFYSLLYDNCEMSLSRKRNKFKYETINM